MKESKKILFRIKIGNKQSLILEKKIQYGNERKIVGKNSKNSLDGTLVIMMICIIFFGVFCNTFFNF